MPITNRPSANRPANDPPALVLFYGNQAYSVNQAADALTDRVLGEGARDFSYRRFDAAEMLKAGNAEALGEAAGDFQTACESAPFLCERWVVRLDHLEAVKISGRAVQNLLRALGEMRVFRCVVEDESLWALEEDLLPSDRREGSGEVQRWIEEVQSQGAAPPIIQLSPDAGEARFLLSRGGARRRVDLQGFLREKLKGRFAFAGEGERNGPVEDVPSGSLSAGARLHQVLERLVDNPPAGLCLVLTATAGRESDLSRPLLQKIRKAGRIEKFVTYDDFEPVDFVLQKAREHRMRMSRPQAALVIQLTGNDLGRLAGEMDKLALLFGEGESPADEVLVRALSGNSRASLFLISDKLGAKDLPGALGVLEQFLGDNPNEHPMLIGILARHVRQLLRIHDLIRLGEPESDWPARLKLHPFIAKRLAVQARRFSATELEAMLRALAGLDVAAKRHSHLTAPLFKDFVQTVCRGEFLRSGRSWGTELAGLS